MKRIENYSDYWAGYWDERSKLKEDMCISGWKQKDMKEYLYDAEDICKKLELKREDELLNIGCANGLLEIVLNYWVKSIVGVDFSKGMIKKARKNNQNHKNVRFFAGNILNLGFLNKRFNKVLCNSVIQYLNSTAEVKKALLEIKKVTTKKSVILISANPNNEKFNKFVSGYDTLGLEKGEAEKKKQAARVSLWTNPKEMKKLAEDLGYKAEIRQMHSGVWQSWYMYDIVLRR